MENNKDNHKTNKNKNQRKTQCKPQFSYVPINRDTIVNENTIRWVQRMSECLEVCIKQSGCENGGTVQICKDTNPRGYKKLIKYFDD